MGQVVLSIDVANSRDADYEWCYKQVNAICSSCCPTQARALVSLMALDVFKLHSAVRQTFQSVSPRCGE